MTSEERILTRRELYDLVWSKPMSKLAVEFGLSDRGLAKLCERHRVPVPPRGYWAKLNAGKKVKQSIFREVADILTLLFGYGLESKIVIALLIIYFPVTSAFFDGLMRTPGEWLEMARVMGATPARVMTRIRILAALPALASGLRLAAVYAPIGAIIGEWVGASQGLGYLMLLANGRAMADLMFAALFILAVLTLILHAAVDRWTRLMVERQSR